VLCRKRRSIVRKGNEFLEHRVHDLRVIVAIGIDHDMRRFEIERMPLFVQRAQLGERGTRRGVYSLIDVLNY
jgi:hypothetical protein